MLYSKSSGNSCFVVGFQSIKCKEQTLAFLEGSKFTSELRGSSHFLLSDCAFFLHEIGHSACVHTFLFSCCLMFTQELHCSTNSCQNLWQTTCLQNKLSKPEVFIRNMYTLSCDRVVLTQNRKGVSDELFVEFTINIFSKSVDKIQIELLLFLL